MHLLVVSTEDTRENRTGDWAYLKPVYRSKTPPCNHACPAGEDVRGVMTWIKEGNWDEALALIKKTNPLPGVCGRVCYHPCETACNRGKFDQPLSIAALERMVADLGIEPSIEEYTLQKGKVAVIGSGPAGLSCAYHLAKKGYAPTIFEKLPVLGGMLRVGIPEYRLPREVLDREAGAILSLGIGVELNSSLGRDFSLNDLRRDYDAVFVATGAHKAKKLDISGERELVGFASGIDFLRSFNLKQVAEIGDRVAVVGGGNVAIDVARTVLRQGGKPLVVYRRSKEEMPAVKEEVDEAEEEGVEILYRTMPTRMLSHNGMVSGLECMLVNLGEEGEEEKKKISQIPGSEFVLDVDMIIPAVGEEPDLSVLPEYVVSRLETGAVGDRWFYAGEGIFLGGDLITGPSSVAVAIGSGREAALAIDEYLGGEKEKRVSSEEEVIQFEDLNPDYFESKPRVIGPKKEVAERLSNFGEVNLGLTPEMSIQEANRCFGCGMCSECNNCLLFCPDVAVVRTEDGYRINYEYCKGCGICAEECPQGCISLEAEEK